MLTGVLHLQTHLHTHVGRAGRHGANGTIARISQRLSPLTAGTQEPCALFPGCVTPPEKPPESKLLSRTTSAALHVSTSVILLASFCNHWLKCQLKS